MKISVHELKERLEQGEEIRLIDVRTEPEYYSERIGLGSVINHPLGNIEVIDANKNETLYLLCQTGVRSGQAQQRLLTAGFGNVVSVEGGLNAWKAAKFPYTQSKGILPIMQQVQLTAGSLVLLGALGSVFFSPAWVWLAVFVGLGLAMTGATGFCGMAFVMARMPWNKTMRMAA